MNASAGKDLVVDNATNVCATSGVILATSAIVSNHNLCVRLIFCFLSYNLACDCDLDGSETTQCDKDTGACKCRPGIGGYRCDKCDRGYYGTAPTCSPCGECFENWDRIVQDLKSNIFINSYTEQAKLLNFFRSDTGSD